MSFPRANIKRFNDESGCAPPPGTYDPKSKDKLQGGVLDTTNRFKESKAPASSNESLASAGKTPVKQLFAVPQPSTKKIAKQSSSSAETSKIKLLEQEVRKLCKERTEKEKVLTLKEEELKKLDGRLHNMVSERSTLQAKIASLEREQKETKKANEILKTKASSSKVTSKKQEDIQHELSTLKQKLSTKDHEISTVNTEKTQIWNFLSSHFEMVESLAGSLETAVETYRKTLSNLNKTDADSTINCKKGEKKKSDTETTSLKDGTLKTENKIKICKKISEASKMRFNAALSEFESSTSTLKEKYSSVLNEQQCLLKDLQQTNSQLQEALDNRKVLEQQRDCLENENSDLTKENQVLSEKCKFTEENHGSLMTQIEEALQNKENIQAQLVDLQKAHELSQSESCIKLKQLEDREVLMGDTTKNLHERIVELQAENEDLIATLKETGELLSKTKEHNMELEDSINAAEQNWETSKRQFLMQIEDLVFEKSRSESEVNDRIESMQVNLDTQKSVSENQICSLTDQLDSNKIELLQLKDKLGSLVYEKSQLHTEIGHLEAKIKLIQSESDHTQDEAEKALEVVPELMARLEEVNSEKTSAEENIKELKEENTKLQETLEMFQADFDEYVKQSEEDKLESQEKILSQTDEIEGLKEQQDQMTQDLDDWLTDKSELDIEVAKLQCRIKVLEMEADQCQQEYATSVKEKEMLLDKIKQEKSQIEKDMEQYGIDLLSNAAQLQTINTQLNCKTEENDRLEKKCNSLQESLSQTEEKLTQAIESINVMKESYASKESNYEKLMAETDGLEEDMHAQRIINEDLQSQLEQVRADFIKRCDERDDLQQKNEVKDKSLAMLSTQVSDLTSVIDTLTQTLSMKSAECEQVTEKLSETEEKLTISSKTSSNYKQQIEDYLEHLQMKCDECDELQQKCEELDSELSISAKEIVDLSERVEAGSRESKNKTKQLIDKYEGEIEELKGQLEATNACLSTEMEEELARYRTMYEELQDKVAPFIEQIDAFELEKQTLLGMNKNTQAEMNKLSSDYARLLGHQNQKQKIKHIMKIKEENQTLKNETMQLRAQVSKQRLTIKKLEEKTAPRKFDPSKSFSHTKENVTQQERPKTPLKDANRK